MMNRILVAALALGLAMFAADRAQAQHHGHGHGHGHHAHHGYHHGSFAIGVGNFGYSQWSGYGGGVTVGYPGYYGTRVYRAPVYYPTYPAYGGHYGGRYYRRPSCGRGGSLYIGW